MNYKINGLNELSKQFSDFQTQMGFTDKNITQRLMLVISEVSEAFEAFRKDRYAKLNPFLNKTLYSVISDLPCCESNNQEYKDLFETEIKDTFEDEIADSLIRLLAICGERGIDIENHIIAKMKYNEMRGFKYGGKKF